MNRENVHTNTNLNYIAIEMSFAYKLHEILNTKDQK